tara:strand:+ start:1559 stop:2083 length:525 start_codon:yes stop_codon:yes gene_type:complete
MSKKETNVNEKLFNLQKEIGTISKDETNPFYGSAYFDINSLIKQLQPLLNKYRLSLKQPVKFDAINNLSYVQTYFECADTSQRSDTSELKLPELSDPQKIGSCITYYRRYTLASLLALQAEDDDANKTIQKDWLNRDTPQFTNVIKYLKEGGKINEVEKKYKLSKAVKDELSKL